MISQKHIDGEWFTSESNYNGYRLQVKMRPDHGAKIHIWDKANVKVVKTFRYNFASVQYLTIKAQRYIDSHLCAP